MKRALSLFAHAFDWLQERLGDLLVLAAYALVGVVEWLYGLLYRNGDTDTDYRLK